VRTASACRLNAAGKGRKIHIDSIAGIAELADPGRVPGKSLRLWRSRHMVDKDLPDKGNIWLRRCRRLRLAADFFGHESDLLQFSGLRISAYPPQVLVAVILRRIFMVFFTWVSSI
jgi:hypothetical protein